MKLSIITPSIRPRGLEITKACLERQTYKEFEWLPRVSIHVPGASDLSRQYNKALSEARGSIFVSLQDWIEIPDNALERIVELYKKPDAMMKAYSFPVGKVDDLDNKEDIRWDWRDCFDEKEMAHSWNWEIDFAAAPMEMVRDAGGFFEGYDDGGMVGSENCDLAYRMEKLGCRFFTNHTTHGVAWDHDKFETNKKKGVAQQYNFDLWNQRRNQINIS